jgi:hypothetical protein
MHYAVLIIGIYRIHNVLFYNKNRTSYLYKKNTIAKCNT